MSREVQQNILTASPDGSVAAIFPGGIEIPTSSPITPNPGNSVRWIEGSTGSVRGLVFAGAAGGTGPPTGLYQTRVRSQATGLLRFADLITEASDVDGSSRVTALVGGGGDSSVILDSNGKSNFLRLFGTIRTQISTVSAANTGNVLAGQSIVIGTFTPGFALSGIGSFANNACLGSMVGAVGIADFFSWAWSPVNSTQYQVSVHNNHPSVTISAAWAGVLIGMG